MYIVDKVGIHELVGALRNTTNHGTLKKQLNRVHKKKILDVPLSKPEKQRVRSTKTCHLLSILVN